MNDAKIYIPFSLLFICCIVYISLSVPSFSLIIHFPRFLYISAFLAIVAGVTVYHSFKNRFDDENLFSVTAISVPFSFIIWLSIIIFINMQHTTKNCISSSYVVVGYEGRYTTGLGILEKNKIKANQWILSIRKNDKVETFVLDKDISPHNQVTKFMNLEFCKGLLGTEYLNLEQIPK